MSLLFLEGLPTEPSPDIEIEDNELLEALKWSKITHLHGKFRSQNVTLNVLWELDDEMLEDCKLNRVEKLQYRKAKESYSDDNKGISNAL